MKERSRARWLALFLVWQLVSMLALSSLEKSAGADQVAAVEQLQAAPSVLVAWIRPGILSVIWSGAGQDVTLYLDHTSQGTPATRTFLTTQQQGSVELGAGATCDSAKNPRAGDELTLVRATDGAVLARAGVPAQPAWYTTMLILVVRPATVDLLCA